MLMGPGSQIGAYEVVAAIGAGGMGEVYRARDSRLNREVALKIIRQPLTDAEHLARFRREAQVLAALNHPHVGSIYELDEVDGTIFLVMELVPGQTLGDLLASRPARTLEVDEALTIARQIAEALEAAHDKGIVHRDLKPANIRVTPDGVVKVLDFGLAKAQVGEAAEGNLTNSPTLTVAATNVGVILGTAAYMSPEQAKGQLVDRRSDIFAFGCVLYEMLAGRAAFRGETLAEILAGVLKTEPDWNLLHPNASGNVTRLLQRCLQKDVKRRLRDIGDARLEIEEALNRPAGKSEPEARRTPTVGQRTQWAQWARILGFVAAGAAAGAIAGWSLKSEPRAPTPPSGHFVITLPSNETLAALDFPAVAIAADGSAVAYVGSRSGQAQLFVRPMNSMEAIPIDGTTNAIAPFFSPDGRWIAFFADGQLKKIPTAGGQPVTLAEASVGVGGSWGVGDTIVFAAGTGSGLSRVSAGGGMPERVTVVAADKGEFSHRWPELLPDGKTVIYTVGTLDHWDDAQIVAQGLGSPERSVLVQGGTNPHYLASGHLLYARGGAIMAVPFDLANLRTSGAPVRVLENVLQSFDGAAQLSVSPSGTAVYVPGEFESNRRRLATVDRSGASTPFAAPLQAYRAPRLSPDGRKLLVTIEGSTEDLWVYDMKAGTLNQLTFGVNTAMPIWTPDSQRVTFSSNTSGTPNLFWTTIGQQKAAERLATSDNFQLPGSWSPDGRTLAFAERHPSTGRDIWFLRLDEDREAKPFLNSPFDESAPRFSPDGRWIAYVSNESGRDEVFLRSLADPARKQQLSNGGGTEPVWARDGTEIFYRVGNKLMALSIADGRTARGSQPRLLFEGEFERGTTDAANYDVTPDNQRFVMIGGSDTTADHATIHVLINWASGIAPTLLPTSR
jgi:eukaryotic-like serine/threonine-protein kinase